MILARWRHWLGRLSASGKTRQGPRARLFVEVLEGRTAPAVFTVNTFDDTVEANRDGSGLDAAGNISLRSAIMATNDRGGDNTVMLSAYTTACLNILCYISRHPIYKHHIQSSDIYSNRNHV